MSDDKLLSALARRAREQRDEPVELAPMDDARIAEKILGAPPKVVPIRRRPVLPFAFAAAAAIALFFLWPRDRELPKYAFELSGQVAEVRSDGPRVVSQSITLHREATLQLVLRPERRVDGVKAAAVLVRDGKARPWTAPIEISNDGSVRIAGPVRTLFPDTDAPWEVVVAIGKELPSDLLAEPPPGVRIARAKISFQ